MLSIYRLLTLDHSTNTHVPAPPWAAVSPVVIPLSTCNQAADLLIDWFQPDELKHTVGGEKWWQVRGLEGVDGEWITEREFIKDVEVEHDHDRKLNSDEEDILKIEHLESVMVRRFRVRHLSLIISSSCMFTEVSGCFDLIRALSTFPRCLFLGFYQ
jgi:hypothetical protein